MSDEETKARVSTKRKRNMQARKMRESGAFTLKTHNPKKGGPYNRKKNKINVQDVDNFEDNEG